MDREGRSPQAQLRGGAARGVRRWARGTSCGCARCRGRVEDSVRVAAVEASRVAAAAASERRGPHRRDRGRGRRAGRGRRSRQRPRRPHRPPQQQRRQRGWTTTGMRQRRAAEGEVARWSRWAAERRSQSTLSRHRATEEKERRDGGEVVEREGQRGEEEVVDADRSGTCGRRRRGGGQGRGCGWTPPLLHCDFTGAQPLSLRRAAATDLLDPPRTTALTPPHSDIDAADTQTEGRALNHTTTPHHPTPHCQRRTQHTGAAATLGHTGWEGSGTSTRTPPPARWDRPAEVGVARSDRDERGGR